MTRPLTKTEIARRAKSVVVDTCEDVSVPQLLLANAMRGVALGIFTPAPITTALVLALVCCFKFIPAVLAIALTVAAHTK